jgi:MerR family transcriptional regulator, light-induced transcriptional regulator
MNSFTIKDLECLSGIKAHTIRIWEQRYNFLKPQRTETNIRYYTGDELKTVLNIALLNKYGFKISHIDKMNKSEIHLKLQSLTDIQAQQERQINALIGHMVDLATDKFEADLDIFIQTKGIEKAINNLLFPFLERVGILWQTNHINPAQEHLVTNIIRQKLLVGIESATNRFPTGKTVLLFLPETEYHELGLLYVYYLLKSRGVVVLYLGANVPLKDVAYIANIKNPQYLYTHITSVVGQLKMEKYLNTLKEQVPEIPFVVSGQFVQNVHKTPSKGFIFKKSLAEVHDFVASFRNS